MGFGCSFTYLSRRGDLVSPLPVQVGFGCSFTCAGGCVGIWVFLYLHE